MKPIDAGHGGGQVLRTALSLAALTGTAVDIRNIRQKRPKPGLQPQHQACVRAVASITDGQVEHDAIGSSHVTFKPGDIRGGDYAFDIGTAGSCSLLLQCILPPLLFADKPSRIKIQGGTDVPFSPPSFFLQRIFAPALEKMGASVRIDVKRHGFYPKGGGILEARLTPSRKINPAKFMKKQKTGLIQASIVSSGLPNHVANREKAILEKYVGPERIQIHSVNAQCAGNAIFLEADCGGRLMGFDALGKIGKSAESVAHEVLDRWQTFEQSHAAIEPHLLDQLLVYAAMAKGESAFKIATLSEHAQSNLRVIHEMLGTTHQFKDGTLAVHGISQPRHEHVKP